MSKTRSENIRLGAFVIIGTACLIFAIYLIGKKQSLFGGTLELRAVFENVNGLQQGNNVRFSGITVGTVHHIEMQNDTMITVHMIIEEDMIQHIRKDAIATIGTDGLVGSMLINITPAGSKAPMVAPGDEITSYSRIATDDMLSTLSSSNDNIALLSMELLEITHSLNSGQGVLGRLLTDTTMGADLSQTISNLNRSSQTLGSTLSRLNRELAGINMQQSPAGVLLNDTLSGHRIRTLIEDLAQSGSNITTLSEDLITMTERMGAQGSTINLLMTDSAFARTLDSTMTNLQRGSHLLNQDLEALQENFLFRRYFKKKANQKQ